MKALENKQQTTSLSKFIKPTKESWKQLYFVYISEINLG